MGRRHQESKHQARIVAVSHDIRSVEASGVIQIKLPRAVLGAIAGRVRYVEPRWGCPPCLIMLFSRSARWQLSSRQDNHLKFRSYRFSVAPMMDWTDRHCRVFHRLMTRRARLYTEMLTTGAIIHGDRSRLLGFDASEHPVALQLGGSDPSDLATAAKIGEDFGYDEINLNVGCPSDRVKDGRFGACLMAEPELVADCVAAMKRAVNIPGHGEVPDRHRRSGSGSRARRIGATALSRPAPMR